MNEQLSAFVADIQLPRFVPVRQTFSDSHLTPEQLPGVLQQQLARVADRIRPGMSVCLTCGSRGIDNIVLVLRTLVEFCQALGAKPFAIPAMGSHGGATAEGQLELLESLGITEQSLGCPIRATMDTVVVGQTEDGKPVHVDAFAAAADAIIVVNRIKPHTSFRGPYESGLMKMMAIGLGKQKGASSCHGAGYKYMSKYVPAFGNVILHNAPVVFGVAMLENAFDRTAELHVLTPEEIPEQEPLLLQRAFTLMPQLFFSDCDVLVVDEIGKNISGGGMDPNITGAFSTPYASGGIQAQQRCILSLTPQTHGNGYGMGAADVVSQRLYDQLDLAKTYPNAITSTALRFARMPLVMPNDRDAIRLCVRGCTDLGPDGPRIIRIRNTLKLDLIWISEAMVEEAQSHAQLQIVGPAQPLPFDEQGNLQEAD